MKPVRKGFREKQKNNQSMITKFANFIPAEYTIIDYIDRGMVFGKVITTEKIIYSHDRWDTKEEFYLKLYVIDYIEYEKTMFEWIKKDIEKSFHIDAIGKLYSSSSFKDTERKWNELAKEWILKRDAEKYNL
jgi:hypothetical protein